MGRSQALARAAEILWGTWQQGTVIESLPPECRPLTRAEGYRVQSGIEARSSGPLFGWKVAATSVAGQRHIRVDGPIAGRLLRERAHPSGSRLSLAGNRMAVAEPEFAFRMGRDILPRQQAYSVDEVMAAIAHRHPSIEVPDLRFAVFTSAGEAQIIADNACAHEFVLGDAAHFYSEYMPRVYPVLEECGAIFLAGSDAPLVKEGDSNVKRVVLLEFESLQRAEEFSHSERYQAIIGLRFDSARSHLYIFEGSES